MNDLPIQVFIVEDNQVYSLMLKTALKEKGNFEITTMLTGEYCLTMLNKNPHVIILDHLLAPPDDILGPGISGLEVMRQIHAKKPNLPVIILSNQTDTQIATDYWQAGVFDYMEKNILVIDKLVASILKAVNK
ncbi:MAG: hypothetical protein A3K10_04625 [Bacteroidetes bacterium RIFCSPLOWO2_12_FULL_31_6]|nr:MAG: hypothetical protein A3K10_04625 [Bacteroidetes bacterium RIFCSPLOWO2_12_FULL_31_6]